MGGAGDEDGRQSCASLRLDGILLAGVAEAPRQQRAGMATPDRTCTIFGV